MITQKSLLSPSASLIPVIIMSLVYILPLPFPEVTPCYMFHIQIYLNDVSWLQHYIRWKYLRRPAHRFKHIHTKFQPGRFRCLCKPLVQYYNRNSVGLNNAWLHDTTGKMGHHWVYVTHLIPGYSVSLDCCHMLASCYLFRGYLGVPVK